MEEVHFWRGSVEQRAKRALSEKSGQFMYFDQQLDHPDWQEKLVLDFGGNTGNLLRDSNGAIRPENYYCLDVLRDAVAEGRQRFPQAHWFHYDRYNCSFNPEGIAGLPIPDMGVAFDAILAYSVFTHTAREEMRKLVHELLELLVPGGTLAFTFIDPHYRSWPRAYDGNNLQWRLERVQEMNPDVNVPEILEKARAALWGTLVDGSKFHVDSNGTWDHQAGACLTYNVFYTVNFLQREFPGATIRPPVNDEMQHCCIIQAPARD